MNFNLGQLANSAGVDDGSVNNNALSPAPRNPITDAAATITGKKYAFITKDHEIFWAKRIEDIPKDIYDKGFVIHDTEMNADIYLYSAAQAAPDATKLRKASVFMPDRDAYL